MEWNERSTAAPPADLPRRLRLTLTARNNSTVPGEQYFNVFPPRMSVTPLLPQTRVAKVSTPTLAGKIRHARLSWLSGPDTLALVVLAPGQKIGTATETPVTLGSTAALAWEDGAFSVSVAPGNGEGVTVIFDPGIPQSSYVGLVVGPAPILVPVINDRVQMTPDLAPIVRVRFGTPWQWGAPGFSDLSQSATVIFAGHEAEITVGADNLIIQTG
jgi:hypothetical protein